MKKKLLFINSSGFYKKNDGLYLYHETAKLIVALNTKYIIDAFHYEITEDTTDNLANFNLSNTNVKISVAKRYKSKIISYLNSYSAIFFKMSQTDFLYLFYPSSFRFSILFALILNKEYALYVRGEKNINNKFSKFIFKKAKFILTVSPKFTEDIKVSNNKVFTIKPMISYAEKDIVEEKKYTEGYKLLYVGRVEKDKGSIELIKAIEKLVGEGLKNIVLTIVGNGDLFGDLKNYVKEKKLTKNIIFQGPIYDSNKLKEIYRTNDIFVLPSHHEGFPRVLYEAMIFKLAILTTFVGTISSVMINEENCLEINVNDFKDIANKLKILFDDSSLNKNITTNATTKIKEYLRDNNKPHDDLIIENFRNEK